MSYQRDAEETNEWDRFWNSGRVDDYLRYKNRCREDGEQPCQAIERDRAVQETKDRFS